MSQEARRSILEQALTATTQERNTSYGEAEDNFAVIAHLTAVYDSAVGGYRREKCPAIDVAVHNILQKIARLVTSPFKEDHWVDIAGYAACGGGIAADERHLDEVSQDKTTKGWKATHERDALPPRSPSPAEPSPHLADDVPAGTNARLDAQRQARHSLD